MKTIRLEGLSPQEVERLAAECMPQELVLIDSGDEFPRDLRLEHFATFARKTTRACPILSETWMGKGLFLEELHARGIRHLCARQTLNPGSGSMGPREVRHHEAPAQRSQTAQRFIRFCENFAERFTITSLLVLEEARLELLAPTLRAIGALGVPWIMLDPGAVRFDSGVTVVREALNWMRLCGFTKTFVYFAPFHANAAAWDAKTDNLFSGPKKVDLDLTNRCTHNCTFCSSYSPDVIAELKRANGGVIPADRVEILSARIDTGWGLRFLEALPDTLQMLQLGGIGDPYTHPDIDEFIAVARRRGLRVSVLSNFSYLDEARVRALHELSGSDPGQLMVVTNVSAATAEIYQRVRPNQTAETFNRVIETIRRAGELARADGRRGIGINFLMVLNRTNFREMAAFVRLGHELGVAAVWLKPLEIHVASHRDQLPLPEELDEYKRCMREALLLADTFGVRLVNRQMMETLVAEAPAPPPPAEVTPSVEAAPASDKIGVLDGGFRADLYSQISCRTGYDYMRVMVDGRVNSCCIMGTTLGSIADGKLAGAWFSDPYAFFREKMQRINIDRYHLNDPEWMFCQQCPHSDLNLAAHELRQQRD